MATGRGTLAALAIVAAGGARAQDGPSPQSSTNAASQPRSSRCCKPPGTKDAPDYGKAVRMHAAGVMTPRAMLCRPLLDPLRNLMPCTADQPQRSARPARWPHIGGRQPCEEQFHDSDSRIGPGYRRDVDRAAGDRPRGFELRCQSAFDRAGTCGARGAVMRRREMRSFSISRHPLQASAGFSFARSRRSFRLPSSVPPRATHRARATALPGTSRRPAGRHAACPT